MSIRVNITAPLGAGCPECVEDRGVRVLCAAHELPVGRREAAQLIANEAWVPWINLLDHPHDIHGYYVGAVERNNLNIDMLARLGAALAVLRPIIPNLPCGGCGETDPANRCVGCRHEFSWLE